MIGNFLKKRKANKQTIIARQEKLKGIDDFPLGDEWTASNKKEEELTELIEFLIFLIDNHDFKVMRSWGTGLPKDCYLRKDYENAEILIETYVDIAGQNYDRVGKILVTIDWHFEGIYDEKKDKYVGEIDKSRDCTLKAVKKILPEIIRNFEANAKVNDLT